MKEDLLEIINHYGVLPQLKYFQSEVFELNEAIINYEYDCLEYDEVERDLKKHITEEIADNFVMLNQFPVYYYELLDVHNIAPYKFKTDNYEHIDNIYIYLKSFQRDICNLTCEVAVAEQREQDYISEFEYKNIIEKIDIVIYKLKSIQLYYKITDEEIEEVMKYKINRQLERIKGESNE